MRTANPALNAKTFKNLPAAVGIDQAMTIQGTVNKTVIMLFLLIIAASWTWGMFYSQGNPAAVYPWMIGGAIGGFGVAIFTVFKKHWAPTGTFLLAADMESDRPPISSTLNA